MATNPTPTPPAAGPAAPLPNQPRTKARWVVPTPKPAVSPEGTLSVTVTLTDDKAPQADVTVTLTADRAIRTDIVMRPGAEPLTDHQSWLRED